MGKIKEIPVIGYLFRLIWNIIKFPRHIDAIYQSLGECQQELEILKTENDLLKGQCKELVSWNRDRMDEIRSLVEQMTAFREGRLGEESLQQFNLMLSTTTTLWGPENRLHISELAALPGCMLNTNSGHISVGDYTFSGSGVSLLAGSHDKDLRDLPRRDSELTQGCDIQIGKGVWLASNCTVLGPATIEDHAVIAAGAVVVPGTNVPTGAIFAGIPAKQIGVVSEEQGDDSYGTAVLAALNRQDGVLFFNGWTEKKNISYEDKHLTGHYLVGNKAEILTDKSELNFYYSHSDDGPLTIEVQVGNDSPIQYVCERTEGILHLKTNVQDGKVEKLSVMQKQGSENVLLAFIK